MSDKEMSEYSSSSEDEVSEEEKIVVPVKRKVDEVVEKSESDASDSSSEDEENEEVDDQPASSVVPSFLSLVSRKSFPFGYWFIYTSKDKQAPPTAEFLEKLKKVTLDTLNLLFKLHSDPEIYILRGSREKDRLRVICPTVTVNAMSALHIRSLILDKLNYLQVGNNVVNSRNPQLVEIIDRLKVIEGKLK
jgi:hypothetical protein